MSAVLKDQIKMAKAIITLKIMPESPDVDLAKISDQAKSLIQEAYGETEIEEEKKPIGFGLVALNVIFVIDEEKGSTDALEEKIKNSEGVKSCEVIDVRRALG